MSWQRLHKVARILHINAAVVNTLPARALRRSRYF
jgi:hypothetical protein